MDPARSMVSACSPKLQTSDGATNLVLSHAPAAQNTGDTIEANDSGYDTRDTTPTVSQKTDSGVAPLEGKVLGPRGLFGRRPTNMTRFKQRPPKPYRDRYLDLKEIFDEKLALKLASKKRLNVRPLDIGLEVLGHDEHDAKPCILVTCNESIRRHVEKFFDQQWIKELLDPNPEFDFPRFDLYIRPIPCRAKAFGPVTVFERKSDLNLTHVISNGQAIFVQADHGWRQAAIGGFIEVIKNTGDSTVYGVTAGHLISPWNVPNLASDAGSSETDSLDEFGASQDTEDDSTEHNVSRDIGLIGLDTPLEHAEFVEGTSSFVNRVTLPVASDLVAIGHIQGLGSALLPTSEPALRTTPDQMSSKALDYALISISENPVDNHRLWERIPVPASSDAADEWIGDYRKVLLLNNSATAVSGILELSMSSLLLENRGRFVTTHKLELDETHKFLDGDSGAWVIDVETNEVYGHVVAVDLFGRAHVVPLSEVLGDVKKVFEAREVRLYRSGPKTNVEDPSGATNELLSQAPQVSLFARTQDVSNQDHGYISRLALTSPEAKGNPVATASSRYMEPLWSFPAQTTGFASPSELGQDLYNGPSEDEHLGAVNFSELTADIMDNGPSEDEHLGAVNFSELTADITKQETTSTSRGRIGQTGSGYISQNGSGVKTEQPSHRLEAKEYRKVLVESYPDALRRNSSRSELSRVSLAKRKVDPLDVNDTAPTLIGEGKEEVQQTLIEPTVEFTDARGRVIQFPYETCKTWSGMRALIEKTAMRYEELNSELINGKYDLVQEKGTIVLPTTWNKLVRPNMSIRLRMWSSKDTPDSEIPHPSGFPSKVLPEQSQPKSAHAPVEPPADDLPRRVLSPPVTNYPGIDIHRPSSHSRSDLDSLDSVSVMSRGNLRMALIRLRVAEAREKQANNRAELAEQSLADTIKEVRSLNYTIETHLSISKKLEWEAHQSRQQGEEAKAKYDQQFAKLQTRADSVQKHLEREQFEQRRNLNRILLFTEGPPETSAVVPLSACQSWKDLVRLVSRLMSSQLNEDFDEDSFVLIDPRGDVILPDFWPSLVEPGWAIQIVTRPTIFTEAVHDRTPDTTKKGQKSVKETLDSPKVLPSLPGKRHDTRNGAETQKTKLAAFSDTGKRLVPTQAQLITRPKIPLILLSFLVYIPLSFVTVLLGMHINLSWTLDYMQLSVIIGSSLAGFALAWLSQTFWTPREITREQSFGSQ